MNAIMAFINSPVGPKTTHFWGPVMNGGFVVQGIIDWDRPAEKISKNMQMILTIYSITFMRFAWRVTPRNYLLFAIHASNTFVQSRLLYRRWSWENNNKELYAAQLEQQKQQQQATKS